MNNNIDVKVFQFYIYFTKENAVMVLFIYTKNKF